MNRFERDGFYWPGPPAPIPPEMIAALGADFCRALLEDVEVVEQLQPESTLVQFIDRPYPGEQRTMFRREGDK